MCASSAATFAAGVLLAKFWSARRQQSLSSDYRHLLSLALKLYVYSADFHAEGFLLESAAAAKVQM